MTTIHGHGIQGLWVQSTQTGRSGVITTDQVSWGGRRTGYLYVLVRAADTGSVRYWPVRCLVVI